jgi:hypothetical protein
VPSFDITRTALVAGALAAGGAAQATTLSYSGNLTADDSIAAFNFVVPTSGLVTVQTFSYAGGTNGASAVIAAGGFDPSFSLFDAGGLLIGAQDDATPLCNNVANDPVTNECFDIFFQATLAAGTYLGVITQFDNVANGPNFSDGFTQAGNPFFTAAFGCEPGQFCDVDADGRTSFWAADVTVPTVVPLPAAGWLLLSGLAGLGGLRRRNRGS